LVNDPDRLRLERQAQARKRRKRLRRQENLGLAGTLVALLLFLAFWLAAVILPLVLMVAAIYFLFTH
jgi:hypothetical protein